MSNNLYSSVYNPDVLSCLANLSNDEVFTPPEIVNQMLDMFPQGLFKSPNTTFLDPACKSGVFLREIAKRLIEGLEPEIPNLQERLDHIFHHQLYGISITELTSLLSRRSVYCSKYPNSKYSVSTFQDVSGNIRFKRIQHRWSDAKCAFCGAPQKDYQRDESLETHAYELIHTTKPEEIFKMKFDVIIGNPPYQLTTGGGQGATASPIYQKFVNMAKKLNPRYFSMIIPTRWTTGGLNLNEFRDEMLNDKRLCVLHDYPNSSECFVGIDISGGVCYFLWDRAHTGDCEVNIHNQGNISKMKRPLLEKTFDTYVRYNEAVTIVKKVLSFDEPSFEKIVSQRDPYGFISAFKGHEKSQTYSIKVYTINGDFYVNKNDIRRSKEKVDNWKVFVSKANGAASKQAPFAVISKPFIGAPHSCCTETYLNVGEFETEQEAQNVRQYLATKFVRLLILLNKSTQNAYRQVYKLVPMQDFTRPWTDKELYAKYGVTDKEIAFIDMMIRPMDLTNGEDNGE